MQNKRIVFWARVAAAIVTVSSIYLFAPWEYGLYYLKPLPDTLQEEVESAADQHIAGIIVYAQRGTDPAETYASGWHSRADEAPAYPEALFKIASIAKLYDAAAVAQLVANGTLSLDDTLAFHLPELEGRIEYADRITLRMMVQHESGIPNFTDQPEFNWGEPNPDVLAMALDKPALFEPGTDWSYSNTNYLLLARVMSRALGHDYTQFIREEMLVPLGLRDTYFSVSDVADHSRLMSGYFVGYEDDLKGLDQGYVASASDVGRFVRALNDGSVFAGNAAEVYADLYEFGHDGWVLGYLSKAWYHADIDTVVVQFINTNGDDTVLLNDIISGRVVDILGAREATP
jgi:CubicO group peptidase (beta-lactamase class C family)